MWIASSVEFGQGIRFVAPTRSRNSSRVSHRRRPTTSRSISAMCAAGPPKPIVPELQEQTRELPNLDAGLESGLRLLGAESSCRP